MVITDVLAAFDAYSRKPKPLRPGLVIMSEAEAREFYADPATAAFYMSGGLETLQLEIVTVGRKPNT
jgi:hypothetical protein